MPAYLIAILLFVLGAAVFAVLQRNNFLEKLPLEAGEKILFEDVRAKFEAKSGTDRWERYPWAFIRVTNRRIILSQGGFLGKKHVLRFVVVYDGTAVPSSQDASPVEILKSGRQQLYTDRKHLQLDQDKDKAILRIFPRDEDVAWFQISEIVVYPNQVEPYIQYLLKQ